MKGLDYVIRLQDKVSSIADKIGGKVQNLLSRMDKLTSVQEKVNISSQKAASGLEKVRQKIDDASSGLGKYIRLAAVAGAVVYTTNVAKGFLDASIEADKFNRVVQFTGQGEGANNLAFFNQTINDLRLPLRESREGFLKMSGAFMDTNLAGQPMRDLFLGTAMASRALGMTGEETGGSILALGQIMSKGTLSAEELRGQLGERLYGAFNLASKAMGVTQVKLNELLQKGSVTAERFLPRFAEQLKKTFADEAVKAAKSPQAMLDALNNKFIILRETIGNKLMPKFLEFANLVLENFDRILNRGEEIFANIQPYLARLARYFEALFQSALPYLNVFKTQLESIMPGVESLFSSIGDLVAFILPVAMQILAWFYESSELGRMFGELMFKLSGIVTNLTDLLKSAWFFLEPVYEVVTKIIGALTKLAGSVLGWAMGKIADFLGMMAQSFKILKWSLETILSYLGIIDKTKTVVKLEEKVTKATGNVDMSKIGTPAAPAGYNGKEGGGVAPAGAISSSEKINQGGSRPVNISIKYDAMNKGGITIHTTNLKEGVNDIQRILEEMLLRTLNGATQMSVR